MIEHIARQCYIEFGIFYISQFGFANIIDEKQNNSLVNVVNITTFVVYIIMLNIWIFFAKYKSKK